MKTFQKRMRIPLLILALFLVIPFSSFADRHAERDIKIWINDFYVMSDVHPFIENNRTYVPIRFIAEELDYNVRWKSSDKTVFITNKNTEIKLTIDSDVIYVNGQPQKIDAPARLKDDRTFVPIRLIAETMGEQVSYDSTYKVAIIGKGYVPSNLYPIIFYIEGAEPIVTTDKFDIVNLLRYTSEPNATIYYSENEYFLFTEVQKQLRIYLIGEGRGYPFIPKRLYNSNNYVYLDPKDVLDFNETPVTEVPVIKDIKSPPIENKNDYIPGLNMWGS